MKRCEDSEYVTEDGQRVHRDCALGWYGMQDGAVRWFCCGREAEDKRQEWLRAALTDREALAEWEQEQEAWHAEVERAQESSDSDSM